MHGLLQTIIFTYTKDAALLARIHSAGFATDKCWSESDFAALLQDNCSAALLATVEGEAGGFMLLRNMGEEAEILTLTVMPKWQRQRIASALLKNMEEEMRARGVTQLWLEVGVNNTAATALYHKAGYTECGRRTGYYHHADGSCEDALLLRKTLT